MHALSRILFCFLCIVPSAGVEAGEVLAQVFRAGSLGRDYAYKIYLPEGYANETKRYPVLYLLHGSGGDENEWLDTGGLRETMDELIAKRQLQPMIVVMPGHPPGWWVEGAETALMQELIPHVEGKFRVDPAPGKRVLAGVSAGGFGALNLVLKYPARFAAAALFSPAVYDPLPPAHSSAMRLPLFQTAGKFDPQRWRALNYTAHIEAYKKSGTIVPLFIHSGDADNLGIAFQSAQLFEKLRLHQPGQVALRIDSGDHEWALWQRALPQALLFLDARIRARP
jgi:enterochelin esterase-like enzyme